jgi:hypothetical protein
MVSNFLLPFNLTFTDKVTKAKTFAADRILNDLDPHDLNTRFNYTVTLPILQGYPFLQ